MLIMRQTGLKNRIYAPQVLDTDGEPITGVYCIGDANGKLMLAHAASAQGICAVECMAGRQKVLNHNSVPAACFTHPEVSFVGLNEAQAKEAAEVGGFKVRWRCCLVRVPVGLCVCLLACACAPRVHVLVAW